MTDGQTEACEANAEPRCVYDHQDCQLFHGDCLQVLPYLPNAQLYLLDMPYGIALREHGRNGHDWNILNDEDQAFGISVLELLADMPVLSFASPMKPWPGKWRQFLVWDKGPTVGGGGDPNTCWKMSWELIQVRGTGQLNGGRDEAVLRYHVTQRDFSLHPCQKPIGLLQYLIRKCTNYGDLVIDPTCGSGSTIRAAMNIGRRAIGIERDDNFVSVAMERMRQKNLCIGDES